MGEINQNLTGRSLRAFLIDDPVGATSQIIIDFNALFRKLRLVLECYCMMIGGEEGVAGHLDAIFKGLAPGVGEIPLTPGREASRH